MPAWRQVLEGAAGIRRRTLPRQARPPPRKEAEQARTQGSGTAGRRCAPGKMGLPGRFRDRTRWHATPDARTPAVLPPAVTTIPERIGPPGLPRHPASGPTAAQIACPQRGPDWAYCHQFRSQEIGEHGHRDRILCDVKLRAACPPCEGHARGAGRNRQAHQGPRGNFRDPPQRPGALFEGEQRSLPDPRRAGRFAAGLRQERGRGRQVNQSASRGLSAASPDSFRSTGSHPTASSLSPADSDHQQRLTRQPT